MFTPAVPHNGTHVVVDGSCRHAAKEAKIFNVTFKKCLESFIWESCDEWHSAEAEPSADDVGVMPTLTDTRS